MDGGVKDGDGDCVGGVASLPLHLVPIREGATGAQFRISINLRDRRERQNVSSMGRISDDEDYRNFNNVKKVRGQR